MGRSPYRPKSTSGDIPHTEGGNYDDSPGGGPSIPSRSPSSDERSKPGPPQGKHPKGKEY